MATVMVVKQRGKQVGAKKEQLCGEQRSESSGLPKFGTGYWASISQLLLFRVGLVSVGLRVVSGGYLGLLTAFGPNLLLHLHGIMDWPLSQGFDDVDIDDIDSSDDILDMELELLTSMNAMH
ncbi:hypothetical protein L1987_38512 [Smallanthus sonchifolius]|uniref:Uncharacterized protein n=1 Tax=Smallanthus sonchifolius TaxID=185202 RepID=A0ACB9HLX8_9ASTR|nr:hypothetical protein L1987_38512 [Smallanthus sonchifolius]